ncbi:MAG: YdcF family protein [Hyphomicrobiales bacterium]|nr:MAG: YdcF family protein [Hyphomicrobiales bacterium]
MSDTSRNLWRAVGLAAALSVAGASVALPAQTRTRLDRSLVSALETRFARAPVTDWSRITGVVVPGGTTVRTAEAIRLARAHPHLRIVLTGPGESEVQAALGAEGIAPARIQVEPHAINTYENAVRSHELVAPKAGERWLLVTSSYHMPRAIGAFYRAGFFVEPWPVDEGVRHGAMAAGHAQHEWLGLIAYWLRGRTIAIFPGERDLNAHRLRG